MKNLCNNSPTLSRKIIRYGILLFLFGLLTGFAIPLTVNPRLGLSSHLEGLFNGMFLVLEGLIWDRLNLSLSALKWVYYLSLYAAYANWVTTLLAAIWGAGTKLMPVAAGNFRGLPWQEGVVTFGLISLSIAIVIVALMLLWGLRGTYTEKS